MGAIGESYVTLTEMKDYLYSGNEQRNMTDRHDNKLQGAIDSVSREVTKICYRQFNRAEEPSVRTYRAAKLRRYRDSRRVWRTKVMVDDFYTTDGLVVTVDGTTVTDYVLAPEDGIVNGEPGWPFTEIQHDSITADSIVTVSAKWGWTEVPDDVKEAVKIAVEHNYSLKAGMFGIAGISPNGHAMTLRDNTIAMAKLKRYRLHIVQFKAY